MTNPQANKLYFVAEKDLKGNLTFEWGDAVSSAYIDWKDAVIDYHPIDIVNGQTVIFSEDGHKYTIGPDHDFKQPKHVGWVDVGDWGKGEPFLIDTHESDPETLRQMLIFDYNHKFILQRFSFFAKRRLKHQSAEKNFDNFSLKELVDLVKQTKFKGSK